MIYVNKKTGWHYLLNDSDNYGYDCYSFNEKLEPEDGFIPFSADMCCCNDQESFDKEEELIRQWNEEMTEEEQINFCLNGMGTDIKDCILIEDEELEEELFDKC